MEAELPGKQKASSNLWKGILLAVTATLIWSGNFIVARSVHASIPPVSLAFYRWLTASLILLPFVWSMRKALVQALRARPGYYLAIGITGVSLFNTLVYVAGKYSPAINLALVGTTSSPIMVIILGSIFLKEKISFLRLAGLITCLIGIFYLLSKGSWENLLALRFGRGDAWILAGALAFAIYTLLVRKKTDSLPPVVFLFLAFSIGTSCLIPFWFWEISAQPPVQWTVSLAAIILYLGLGASVIAFLCWNGSIKRIGAVRTSLFGNLIPLFSSLEAVWLLGEKITYIHLISGGLILIGLILANLRPKL
ncbi:DMT family transporter [Flavihumibacter sp. UBA7668]|uniref:DMT family transporter n=1 Tax=Flavihumibacter sp. UBA7668 TaxID=1946542 RepID=UPI0025C4CAA7|nr:DMT family transporter [Flavihumibacter sp. UBA7668]